MRRDIQQNERAYSSKEVAEEVGIATPTVRKYSQILEKNGYEFLKDGDRRIFVQSDIETLIALRDTDKPLDDTAKDLVYQQKEKLEGSSETEIAISDTYDNLPQDPNELKEILMFLVNELAATREMNVQMTNDISQLKTTVSRLQQDHHAISSNIANSAQKTHGKIERLTEQQKTHYETLLQQEKQINEFLQKEIHNMRDEQKNEWRSQNDFNKRLEEAIQKPKGKWERLFFIFRK
ncbi:winged helix-turn-helix domain-containing protein [Bacillus sp. EB600]|uniref:winged helix-turn-helix domain-containing protein n=1 Tax=Bacillus sp. EB600 TaxID=2806345 RepID=UPI002109E05F|nr:winged helix-turn-helix domain-containing protein [Bacillus sp. EB600]MCQ6280043.1 winged helix-turn-helix transcriptional regulator [Bacillus sp. EB600]